MNIITRSFFLPALALIAVPHSQILSADSADGTLLRTEHFDRDPGWDARNSRIVPKKPLTVRQDFGFNATNFAGAAKGEIGGAVERSTTPASYAVALVAAKTLADKLSASGMFAITSSQGSRGVFSGLFTSTIGGQMVKIYFDDLSYTACSGK